MNKVIIFLLINCIVLLFVFVTQGEPQPEKYWVFFLDKDRHLLTKAATDALYRRTLVSERSLKRRRKTLGDQPIQETDIPVSTRYLQRIAELGIKPVTISRWLNAGSYYLTDSQVEIVRHLPFVKEVRRIARYAAPEPKPIRDRNILTGKSAQGKDIPQVYGISFKQNMAIGAIDVHQAGITGKGILIGILDTGYDRDHEALEQSNVLAEYDFIHGDGTTSNENEQDVFGQESHGTNTFSVIAGYQEGSLIGVAHDAHFALAKTEEISSETSIEEDFWVAGLEWLDSLGADIVSSSLGYTQFEDASFYLPTDMDGNTAVTTIAADLAVLKGIVVVNSAGNDGDKSWRIINAPSDGFYVLAVGAVTPDSSLASFSSVGPTVDGRIKPDVVAQGVSVVVASSSSFTAYSSVNGTSFSCPLTAGVAALVLSSHPKLSSFQVIDALKETASLSDAPDNFYGWGVINAFSAVSFFGPAFSNVPEAEVTLQGSKIITRVISEKGVDDATVKLNYARGLGASFNTVALQPTGGQSEYSGIIPVTSYGETIRFYFSAADVSGQKAVFPDTNFVFTIISGETEVLREQDGRTIIPSEFSLADNYPNPFNNSTTINVDLKQAAKTTLTIYDSRGRHVRTLQNGSFPAGTHTFIWDGKNDSGLTVASGIYFYRLTVPGFVKTKKMVLVK